MSDIFTEHLTTRNNYIVKRANELRNEEFLQKSVNLFEVSLQKSPNDFRLYFEFSLFLYQSFMYKESLQIAKILDQQFKIESSRLSHLIADSYFKLGDVNEAIRWYELSLKRDMYCEGAAINLSAILGMQGNINRAIEILSLFLKNSESFDASLNLANLKYLSKDYIGAKDLYLKCLQQQPDHLIAQTNIGECARITCDWGLLEDIETQISVSTATALANGSRVYESSLHHLFRCSKAKENLQIAQSNLLELKSNIVFDSTIKNNNRSLRVAYLSDDFGEHPVAYLLLPILKLHKLSQTQTFLLQYGSTDNSNIRKALYDNSSEVLELRGSTESIIKGVRDLHIDILIDLKGLTINHRQHWLQERLAPIQVSFLGYTGTTANPSIDYIISDNMVLTKQNKNFYTEEPLFMDPCFMPMDLDEQVDYSHFVRSDFGLPSDRVVLLVSVKPSRVSKELFQTWLEVLVLKDSAVIWFINYNEASKSEMMKVLSKYGLSEDRLIFQSKPSCDQESYLNRKEHLARLSLADLVLDTWNYNGHSTTVDAIIARREVLTLKGEDWSSRVSASILNALGNENLVYKTKEGYKQGIIDRMNYILANHKIGDNQIDLSKSTYSLVDWFESYENLLKDQVLLKRKKTPNP
ncbi:MAG: hypothetical protein KC646_02660 [Candidatus Cloacimonetes bacterium]|nr:hypothetical protein [Candidatus Cloacimonadota bacterium]